MRIGLDVDDVLLPCTSIVIDELALRGIDCPWHKTLWKFANLEPEASKKAQALINTPSIFQKQKVFPAAQQFVRVLLTNGHDVFFCTAVPTWEIEHRDKQLNRFFPEVSHKNHVFCQDKSVLNLDVLLDDAPHNVEASTVKYPLVWDAPWNKEIAKKNAAGNPIIRVYTYRDALDYIALFAKEMKEDEAPAPQSCIFCLVGPSASGKTALAEELVKTGGFVKPQSATTRKRREGEADDAYYFLAEEEFEKFALDGNFVEQTNYNGHNYGLPIFSVKKALATGKDLIIPIDINGANALKKACPDITFTIFVERPIKDILKALIDRDMPNDALLERLSSMKEEFANRSLCDYVLVNLWSVEKSADNLRILTQGIKELASEKSNA